MRYPKQSNALQEKVKLWLLVVGEGKKWGLVLTFSKRKGCGDWLHVNVNMLNTSIMYT